MLKVAFPNGREVDSIFLAPGVPFRSLNVAVWLATNSFFSVFMMRPKRVNYVSGRFAWKLLEISTVRANQSIFIYF